MGVCGCGCVGVGVCVCVQAVVVCCSTDYLISPYTEASSSLPSDDSSTNEVVSSPLALFTNKVAMLSSRPFLCDDLYHYSANSAELAFPYRSTKLS